MKVSYTQNFNFKFKVFFLNYNKTKLHIGGMFEKQMEIHQWGFLFFSLLKKNPSKLKLKFGVQLDCITILKYIPRKMFYN